MPARSIARLYSLLVAVALPFALIRLFWRSRRTPAYREHWQQRLARFGDERPRAHIWIHAVSFGEVQAAQPLIEHLLRQHPTKPILVTTTTPTGKQRLHSLFPERVTHLYTPYDLYSIMARFLDRVSPHLVIVMETEIWPNMLRACEERGIDVVLANARLSERSARGYARLGKFTRTTLSRFTAISAQSEADARRFRALGANKSRVRVTGSIKFDTRLPSSLLDKTEVLRRLWGTHRSVWVAASTHEGEDEQVLDAHRAVLRQCPSALLVLVPRHPERFDRVAALVKKQGFDLARRSLREPCSTATQVYLGDTMGELPVLLSAADAAFIGGSLVPVGGHNLLEAAAVGVPAAIGPHVFNFTNITRLLIEQQAAVQIENSATLGAQMVDWLGNAAERARVGENGLRVIELNRGALERLLLSIEDRLREPPNRSASKEPRPPPKRRRRPAK